MRIRYLSALCIEWNISVANDNAPTAIEMNKVLTSILRKREKKKTLIHVQLYVNTTLISNSSRISARHSPGCDSNSTSLRYYYYYYYLYSYVESILWISIKKKKNWNKKNEEYIAFIVLDLAHNSHIHTEWLEFVFGVGHCWFAYKMYFFFFLFKFICDLSNNSHWNLHIKYTFEWHFFFVLRSFILGSKHGNNNNGNKDKNEINTKKKTARGKIDKNRRCLMEMEAFNLYGRIVQSVWYVHTHRAHTHTYDYSPFYTFCARKRSNALFSLSHQRIVTR